MAKTDTQGRNLVLCLDGTNNEIGTRLSNILKLYKIAEKTERQVTYYHPGIGTIAMPAPPSMRTRACVSGCRDLGPKDMLTATAMHAG